MNLGIEKNVRELKLSEQDRAEISEAKLFQIMDGLVSQGQDRESGLHSREGQEEEEENDV